jgi:hypothetical protein
VGAAPSKEGWGRRLNSPTHTCIHTYVHTCITQRERVQGREPGGQGRTGGHQVRYTHKHACIHMYIYREKESYIYVCVYICCRCLGRVNPTGWDWGSVNIDVGQCRHTPPPTPTAHLTISSPPYPIHHHHHHPQHKNRQAFHEMRKKAVEGSSSSSSSSSTPAEAKAEPTQPAAPAAPAAPGTRCVGRWRWCCFRIVEMRVWCMW